MYEKRIQEIEAEIQSVRSGEYRGATIVPRVAFIRESFRHLDEFSAWGLGVCTKHRIKAWYESSDLNIANYNNVNNAFLQYWITGGIFGLALVLFICGPGLSYDSKKEIFFLDFCDVNCILYRE